MRLSWNWKTWLKQWAAALSVCSLLSLVFALQQVRVAMLFDNRRMALWTALWPMFTTNWIHGLLAPAVISWARWLELHRAMLARFVMAHAAGYLTYIALHAMLRVLLFTAHNPRTGELYPRSWQLVRNVFVLYSGDDLFMYVPLVGATMAYAAYRRSRQRELAQSRLRELLAGAELQILKMQLQPHFLFNTLQAISTLVGKDPATAKRMIALLGDLLRAVIDRTGEQEVPLKDELDLLDRYVQIELVRFGDRLVVDFDIDNRTLDYLAPSLLLQPIVENAIRHGARAAVGIGNVRIAAAIRDGRLVLTVADNGPGLPAVEPPTTRGLGLDNTRARLRALYGDDHRMDLRNRETGGLLVTIEIPACRAEGQP